MAFAPEAPMRACLKVLYHAAVEARLLGYNGAETGLSATRCEQLADLMDAVHDIPELLGRWEACNEALLVNMLKDYDRKWAPRVNLAEVYASATAG